MGHEKNINCYSWIYKFNQPGRWNDASLSAAVEFEAVPLTYAASAYRKKKTIVPFAAFAKFARKKSALWLAHSALEAAAVGNSIVAAVVYWQPWPSSAFVDFVLVAAFGRAAVVATVAAGKRNLGFGLDSAAPAAAAGTRCRVSS